MLDLPATTLATMPHGATISDARQPDYPLIYVNSGFEQLTGYSAQEVLGRNCRFLQGEDREQEGRTQVRQTLLKGQSRRVVFHNYRKDGLLFWNELTLYPLWDAAGALTHYVGIQYDITEIIQKSLRLVHAERTAAQEAADHARAMTLLNEMSRELNLSVAETDVFRVAAHYIPLIVAADCASIALLDDAKDQVELISLTGDTSAPAQGQRFPLHATDVVQAIHTKALLTQLNVQDDSLGAMRAKMNAPLITSGQTIGALSVASIQPDAFTERDGRRLEQIASLVASNLESRRLFAQTQQALAESKAMLQQLTEAQSQLIAAEKMAALGRLVAGLAHEINTPIGIAVTAASLWEDETKQLTQRYQQGQLTRADLEGFLTTINECGRLISNNLGRAADLIQSFKQVAVDQTSDVLRRFTLKEYLSEVLASLAPELRRTHLALVLEIDEELVLESYPGALAQIITSLVMNSLAHAYEPNTQGALTIHGTRIEQMVTITYADDGKGIPDEHLSKIFEPFFTTRRGQGGSGLGLHIVYNLVTQRLRGSIRCQSQLGAGTQFFITLPLSASTGSGAYPKEYNYAI
ncbi:MAG: ATP-binding protein [Caldilineaceae bacterium]